MKLITATICLTILCSILTEKPVIVPSLSKDNKANIINLKDYQTGNENKRQEGINDNPLNLKEKMEFINSGPFDKDVNHALFDILPHPINKFTEGVVSMPYGGSQTKRIVPEPIVPGQSVHPEFVVPKTPNAADDTTNPDPNAASTDSNNTGTNTSSGNVEQADVNNPPNRRTKNGRIIPLPMRKGETVEPKLVHTPVNTKNATPQEVSKKSLK